MLVARPAQHVALSSKPSPFLIIVKDLKNIRECCHKLPQQPLSYKTILGVVTSKLYLYVSKHNNVAKRKILVDEESNLPSHQSVFKDEAKLDINYIPQQLPHREKEHRLLMEFFSFLSRYPERMAQRVIITGDVGTGKTVLAQHFGASIVSETNKRAVKLRYVHINCREYRGSLQPILHQAVTVSAQNIQRAAILQMKFSQR
jgi:DNA replication protein DnaC